MSKDKIKFPNANFNASQQSLALEALKGLRDLIQSYMIVKNPVGQYFQRIFDFPIVASIKVKGRKTPLTVELPKNWTPAYNPKTERRNKGEGSMFLKYLAAGAVSNPIATACELLVWDVAKLITATQTSKEGKLHADSFDQRESGGLEVISLTIGPESWTRDDILAKKSLLQNNINLMVEAGILKPQKSSRVITVDTTVKL